MLNDPILEAVINHKTLKKSVREEERIRAIAEASMRADERILQSEIALAMQFWAAIQAGMSAGEIRTKYLRTNDWSTWSRFKQHFPDNKEKVSKEAFFRSGDTLYWNLDGSGKKLAEPVLVDMSSGSPVPDINRGSDFYTREYGSVTKFVSIISEALGI